MNVFISEKKNVLPFGKKLQGLFKNIFFKEVAFEPGVFCVKLC